MVNTIISLVWFVLLTVTIIAAINSKGKQEKLIFIISLFLLVYKTVEQVYYIAIGVKTPFPVELSAVTYFVFSIVMLFKIKKLEEIAVFCALISGFFFMLTFIVTGGKTFDYSGSLFKKIMAVVNHSLLYAGGLLKLKFNSYPSYGKYKVICGLGVLVFYSWVMKQMFDFEGRFVFIHQLMTADIVFMVFPTLKEFGFFLPLYYTVFIAAVFAGVSLFYRLNKKLYAVHQKQAARKTEMLTDLPLNRTPLT